MADFAIWMAAVETLHWEAGTFARVYEANRADAVHTVLEDDLVAMALRRYMEGRFEIVTTAKALLSELGALVQDHERRDKSWPRTAQHLAGQLRKLGPALREVGISIEKDRGTGRSRERYLIIRRENVPPPTE